MSVMLTSDAVRRFFVGLFVLAFFLFLFGPLIVMGITAFNSSTFPRVTPWECFSSEWFKVLFADRRLMEGLRSSLIIGLGVVCVAVPLGLAGALLLTNASQRVRPWYYTIAISPILIPGVVLGISTLIFWDRLGQTLLGDSAGFFSNGFFLTIIGQATFISAYTMLVFLSRLQRFDRYQEEAALDLGATQLQTFRKILLPFLKPALLSASVLAFLASFENYNTTVFTVVTESTLTTVLASQVRYGINPSISALAVIIVAVTLFGACLHELLKRREMRRAGADLAVASGAQRAPQRRFFREPALYMIIAVFVAMVGTVSVAGTLGVDQCKAEVKERKRQATQARIEAQRARQAKLEAERKALGIDGSTTGSDSDREDGNAGDVRARGTENFQGIFSPDNLRDDANTPSPENDSSDSEGEKDKSPPVKGTESFQGIFNPSNLQ